jgi:hypothetical protein
LQEAVAKYNVNYVECFGPALPQLYAKAGFSVESKSPFNEEYAPSNWNYQQFGRPDYYTMRINK